MNGFKWIFSLVLVSYVAGNKEQRLPYHELSKQIYSHGRSEALFGYSIAYQNKWKSLIVGSPKASSVGELYDCPVSDNKCKKLNVPIPPEKIGPDAWFGATVTAGTNFIMACGPRMIDKKIFSTSDYAFTGTLGRCYYRKADYHDSALNLLMAATVSVEARSNYHMSAYDTKDNLAPELLMDSFGWSSHVSGDTILVGGPAMSIGRVMTYSQVDTSPELITVNNVELKNRDRNVSFNFGYSITSGNFIDKEITIYAISTTYGTIGQGRVLLFSSSEPEFLNDDIEADSIGSMFGAALCSMSHPNGSALLVGAPASALSASSTGSDSHSYDVGAVYIYTFKDEPQYKRKLIGYQKGGYFGNAIVTVGDHNGDHFDEVAISAPYEDEGRGAVYLYSGKQLLSKDLEVKWLQRIVPKEAGSHYFGLTLSALSDADENGCNELAIGAPASNTVMLLRCMASVDVQFHVVFPDLTKQGRELSASSSSFTFTPCLNVTYPLKPNPISTDIMIAVNINHPNITIRETDATGKLTFVGALRQRKPQYCKTLTVLLPQNGNYDHDINFNFTALLNKNPLELTKFDPGLVLINNNVSLWANYTAPPLPGSNLTFQVTTTLHNGYVIGSTENETLKLEMWNTGNTAYGACVRVRLTGVKVSQYSTAQCTLSGATLTCTPKPPLQRGAHWATSVTLAAKQLTNLNENVVIEAELLKNCVKKISETHLNITLLSDRNIVIRGLSTPSENVNITKAEMASVEGKHIEHIYAIINNGITKWVKVKFELNVPPYITRSVSVGSSSCKIQDNKAICVINELKRHTPTNIKVLMDIQRGSPFIDEIKKGNATAESVLYLILGYETKYEKIRTIITIWQEPTVPLWIIIVAALVGILILLILGWILHECGCLRRKHKEELQELKKDVRRQSIRRSMRLRSSTIEVVHGEQPGDRQQLMQVPEESDDYQHGDKSEDEARAAFSAELDKALKKDKKVVTKAEVHSESSLL